MARTIQSLDHYIAADKQYVEIFRNTSRTAVANAIESVMGIAGIPGAGTLAGSNTANGVKETDATAGYPIINPFVAGGKGYITNIDLHNTVVGHIHLVDVLFKAGAYAFNANVTLASQPDLSNRIPMMPDGATPDWTNTEIWIEAVTAFTGNLSIRCTYLDQGGAAGDTGVIATGIAPIIGRCYRMPFASGDSGVRRIDSVISTVSTVGTFNVLIVRKLFMKRVFVASKMESYDLSQTGMPEVFDTSALALYVQPDSTATQLPYARIEIASKAP